MNWKYKIEVSDKNVFEEIEKERGITIPENLKELIVEANAATPAKHRFMVGSTERVFGSVLSFNKDETDTDSVFTALEAIEDKNLFPFALDPFGNYICDSLQDGMIVFWDHENNDVSSTGKGLREFLEGLY